MSIILKKKDISWEYMLRKFGIEILYELSSIHTAYTRTQV